MTRKKYKSIRYTRPPPSNEEVLDWCRKNWEVLRYWENIYILNPDTKGTVNPSWDQFNCKLVDLMVETPGYMNILETDPTVLMQSFGQNLVYEWYITNEEYYNSLKDRKVPNSKQLFFHPDEFPFYDAKHVRSWIFVRETDPMIQRVCNDPKFHVRVVEIPL